MVFAQFFGAGIVHVLANILIVALVIGALLYIAQATIGIPPMIMRIIWIILGVIVAVIAIRFLETLV